MSFTNLPAPPAQTPMLMGSQSIVGLQWISWFRTLTQIVLTASQIDATSAAAAATAAATAALSYSSSAASSATSAAASSTYAATSAANASGSAAASASSATSAAASAASALAAATTPTFSPYNISTSIVVPVNTQWLTFDRVTLQVGGRMQINGRGRIFS